MKVLTLGLRLVLLAMSYSLIASSAYGQSKLTLEHAILLANQQDDKIRYSQLDQQRLLQAPLQAKPACRAPVKYT